jgi:hypothetical protein
MIEEMLSEASPTTDDARDSGRPTMRAGKANLPALIESAGQGRLVSHIEVRPLYPCAIERLRHEDVSDISAAPRFPCCHGSLL